MSFNYADILKVFMKYSYLGSILKLLCTIVVFPWVLSSPLFKSSYLSWIKVFKEYQEKNQKIISLDLCSWGCFNHSGHGRQRTRWNDLVRLISKFLILFSHTVVAKTPIISKTMFLNRFLSSASRGHVGNISSLKLYHKRRIQT